MLAVLQQPEILEPLLLVVAQLVDDRLQLVDVGHQRLAAGLDVRRGDGGHPALAIGVVQRAVDHEQSGEPLAQLVEPDVAQRLGVVFGRARVLHLRRHAADRHAAGQQRQQRVAHRVIRQRRLRHRDGVRIGNHHRRVVAEHLLAAVEVVPAAHVRADEVLAQHPHDGFLLQRVFRALVQHLDLQRAARQPQRLFELLQQRGHQPRFLPGLDLRHVVVDAGAVLLLRVVVVAARESRAPGMIARHLLRRRARSAGCAGAGPARGGKSSATSPAAGRSGTGAACRSLSLRRMRERLARPTCAPAGRAGFPRPDTAGPCSRRRRLPSPTSTTPRRCSARPSPCPRSIAGPVPSRPGFIVSAGIGTDGFSRHACGVLRPKNPSSIP